MEIQNPGMLPFGMTLDDFKAGVSKVRNRVIARVFRELGLMEEWGSGYNRIMNACRAGLYPEPEWQELGTVIRVVFSPYEGVSEQEPYDDPINDPINDPMNSPINVPVNKRQRWFLEQLATGTECRSSDLANHWSVSEKTAKRDIADLKQKDMILFSGAPKNGCYYIKEQK